MDIINPKIEEYAEKHSSPEAEILKELAKDTWKKTQWPQMQVGHLEGLFLQFLVRISQAKRVLEIGTFTGYSALSMARGLPEDGKLITLDIDPVNTRIAQDFWKKDPSGKKIELKLGPALESLKDIKGVFDLVFVDADKENYANYWDVCVPIVRQGGILLIDNVLWSGKVLKPKDLTDRAITGFNKHAASDSRVDLVLLSVRDGITMAIKK